MLSSGLEASDKLCPGAAGFIISGSFIKRPQPDIPGFLMKASDAENTEISISENTWISAYFSQTAKTKMAT
jgi:hypothetical protein